MAKSAAKENQHEATFEIRFYAPGLEPEKIPPRILYDALSAIQDLASGRDPFETQHVSPEQTIGLIDVRRGSAIYRCVARDPKSAMKNLLRVGVLLSASVPQDISTDADELAAMLRPIEALSDVAKSVGGRVEVSLVGGKTDPLFVVQQDDYKQLSKSLFLSGETTIIGTVERVGGATEMKCLLRVPGRRRLLYCNIENRDVARRLGQHLYEKIVAQGTAIWIHRTWRIVKFRIGDFAQPSLGDPDDAIMKLRDAGLNAWDKIGNPEGYLRECHS